MDAKGDRVVSGLRRQDLGAADRPPKAEATAIKGRFQKMRGCDASPNGSATRAA